MEIREAVLAAAHDAPASALDSLQQVEDRIAELGVDNGHRAAHLIGQCAHESVRFTRVAESLFYTDVARLMMIFGRHFENAAEAAGFLRSPERLANRVYANRNGNGDEASGDGFRFRGRGYLQLTGRDNYRIFGDRIGVDLVAAPERAEEPVTAWVVASSYFANRRRTDPVSGELKTALEWADENNVEAVTRIVNGGLNGLADRRNRTARARRVLLGEPPRPLLRRGDEGEAVLLLQRALAAKGFSPGALDGDFGPRTEAAVERFQAAFGLSADGVVGEDTWAALEPLPS